MRKIIAVLVVCLHAGGLQAAISFGSPQSALEANGGSITFNPTSSVTLSNGTLRDAGSAGNIANASGKSMACSGMTIETKEGTTTKSMKTDGTLDTDGATLAIGNNQVLTVAGGSVAQAVTASGSESGSTPSIIAGDGAFGGVITVADNAELVMRWQGDLNQNIDLNSAGTNNSKLTLENDLTFLPGKTITAAGNDGTKDIVDFNGHTISFNAAAIGQVQQWDTAKVNLDGSLTVNANVTLGTAAAVINAQGNDLAGTAGFIGSQDATLINGKVTTATVLGGTGTWNLDNVLFNYNSAAARVVTGSVDTSTALLSGAVSLGASTVELLSDVTAGGTWTLTGDLQLIGNGHKLDLSSNNFAIGSNGVTVSDGYLSGLTSSSLGGTGAWTFTNTVLDDGSEAVRVLDGSITSHNTDVFGNTVTWGASTLELIRNVAPGGAWTLATGSEIHGNDKKLSVANGLHAASNSASFTLTDVYLDGVTSNSLKSAGSGAGQESTWSLTNVTFDSGSEAFKVLEGDLENTANETSTDTDPFTAAVTWTAANMELLRDTSPLGAWTVATSFALNGNGYKFDTAGITLPGSTTGTLRNLTIDNFDSSSLIGSLGSSSWDMQNVTLQTTTEALRVVEGSFTSNTNAVFSGSVEWGAASNIELLKDLNVAGTWTTSSTLAINGNGNNLVFTDTNGIIQPDENVTLKDVVLSNVSAASFNNGADISLLMDNVAWHDSAQAGSVRIGLSPYTADEEYAKVFLGSAGTGDTTGGALFGNTVEFGASAVNGAKIDLLRKCTLGSTWRFEAESLINGNGHIFNLSGGILDFDEHLHLNNIVLGDVANTSFDRASSKTLFMNDVTWVDNTTEGAIRVLGSTQDSTSGAVTEEAEVVLEADSTAGEIFNTSVTFASGVNMELLSNVSLGTSAAWTFSEASVINGNGHVLDLSADPNITVSEDSLTLSNMVITGWGNGGITFTGARLILSNVTIILDANVTLESTESITINGPVTINTAAHVFNASAAGSNNKINGVTVWYDTLGSVDNSNAKFGAFGKDTTVSTVGRVAAVGGSIGSSDQTYSSGSPYVTDSLFLNYDVDVPTADGTYEASGQQVTLDNSGGAFTVQGNGRTLYFGNSSDHVTTKKLVTVGDAGSGAVTITDLTFDGWSASHFTDASKEILYGNGSVLKLEADETLTTTIALGAGATGEAVVIDLNGYDLDLSDGSASLSITETTSSTITIKNGRIINLIDESVSGAAKILPTGVNPTLVFQDIDLVLSGDTTLTACNLQFKGDCSITGTGNYELKCYHNPITIADGACLKVAKDMTLGLYGNGTSTDTSITFGSNNSTLEMVGSKLDVSNLVSAPTFTHGTLRVDDIVTLSGSMTLGSATAVLDLDVDLMPAASIVVDSGTVTYVNG